MNVVTPPKNIDEDDLLIKRFDALAHGVITSQQIKLNP